MTTHRNPTPDRDPAPSPPATRRMMGAAAPAALRTSRLSLARFAYVPRLTG
ncbi:MAG: hypothetical protein JOZ15_15785 [Acidobacteria bacterium]|nr:hypothetical protein [Acidobacteriota bacterium]